MAKIESIVPFILKWETGNVIKPSEPYEAYYNRCKASKGGVSDDPDDSGGYTVCGVTFATFRTYCKVKKLPEPSKASMMKSLTYKVWLDVLTNRFWDKCKCEAIVSPSIAHIVLDWFWCSGFAGIKEMQRSLSLQADGLIGPKTLAVLNSGDHKQLFERIKASRERYLRGLAEKRPKNEKFLKGWLNRLNNIPFRD